jgi:hypothetical protein
MFRAMLLAPVVICAFAVQCSGDVYVKGYFRKDGTYVPPHYRSDPDGNLQNNWSTYGNVNPYTGKVGTQHVTRLITPSEIQQLNEYRRKALELERKQLEQEERFRRKLLDMSKLQKAQADRQAKLEWAREYQQLRSQKARGLAKTNSRRINRATARGR